MSGSDPKVHEMNISAAADNLSREYVTEKPVANTATTGTGDSTISGNDGIVDVVQDCVKDESIKDEAASSTDIDLYAYTKEGKFTSEIFKIELSNLPDYVGFGQLKKRLLTLGLKPVKLKMFDRSGNAFVTFRNNEEREEALKKCKGHVWKGRTWSVKVAAPAADPLQKKRKIQSENDVPHKMLKEDESPASIAERLNLAVTPLYQQPYNKQLETKQDVIKSYLKKLSREILSNNSDMNTYIKLQKSLNDGLCCRLDPIKPSPQQTGYRNKCEFSIGKSLSGKDKTVGFRLGRYNRGIITVHEVDSCVHVPDAMKQVVKKLQTFLQDQSQLGAYDPESKSGHWRQVTVRNNDHGAIMIMLHFNAQQLSPEEISEERQKVLNYFQAGPGSDCGVTSIYFIVETDRNLDPKTDDHLFGETHIEEELLGLTFRVSPAAFFQVNTQAAEVLYSTVAEWSLQSAQTVLLDVCCGTGTIGLTMAKGVAKVVGVELCLEAVQDARVNAEKNGVENAQYFCSKAEQFLPSYLNGLYNVPVVAVVDPPRGGLHPDVVRGIRKCSLIKRVVYVSCNPNGALQNIVDFTRKESKRVRGQPFRLVQAVAVDMFPHTPHCELVMLLDRQQSIDEATAEAKTKDKMVSSAATPPASATSTAAGAVPPAPTVQRDPVAVSDDTQQAQDQGVGTAGGNAGEQEAAEGRETELAKPACDAECDSKQPEKEADDPDTGAVDNQE